MVNCLTLSFSTSECRSKREMPSVYPHAKGILCALKDKGIDIAIASRSPTPDIARTFLDKLGIQSMFVAQVSSLGFHANAFFFLALDVYQILPSADLLTNISIVNVGPS